MPLEKTIWQSIRDLPLRYAERLEAKSVGAGFPDIHVVFPPDQSWFIESKRCWIYASVRYGLPPNMLAKVRATQVRWHTMFSKASPRSAFLLVANDGRRYAVASKFVSLLASGDLPMTKAIEIAQRDWTVNGLHTALRRAGDVAMDRVEDSAGIRTLVGQTNQLRDVCA